MMTEGKYENEAWQLETTDRLARIEAGLAGLTRQMFDANVGVCTVEKDRTDELFARVNKIESSEGRHWGIVLGVSAAISFVVSLAVALREWLK